jgi:dihydropteroate synthase
MEEAPGRVVFEVPCTMVALGPHRFDIRHRPVLVGHLGPSLPEDDAAILPRARALVASGADALEVAAGPGLFDVVEALRAGVDVPLCVVTEEADVLERALAAGAVVAVDPSGFGDPDYLEVAVAAGASVVALPGAGGGSDVGSVARRLRDRAEQAEAAGLDRSHVLIDTGVEGMPDRAAAGRLLRGHRCLTALGWPVSLGVTLEAEPTASVAAVALGTALGVRVLRVRDVRRARRAADVVAAILRARTEAPA